MLENVGEEELDTERDVMSQSAQENIAKIQQENCKTFNKNRKNEHEYKAGDLVAIKKTQFGTVIKLRPSYLGPYKITVKLEHGRYEVEKVGNSEGPNRTNTVAENMKAWH